MKKVFITLSFLFVLCTSGYSQIYVDKDGNVYDQRQKTNTTRSATTKKYTKPKSNNGFDISKLSIGGGIGLQFGDYTVINVSPQIGYDFSKYFTAGAGFGYTYFKDDYYDYDYKASYLSFNLFGRFYPVDFLVIGIQPEISRMWQTVDYGRDSYSNNEFVPSFLVGGGVRFGGVTAMIQYDVVQDKNSPYGDNIFYSVGYTFRF
ncbi:MAG: hypothetical protein E6767_13850 [Dysgonomonas sp.]|nr:hypothetical protein [Dysgonomonas sp.]